MKELKFEKDRKFRTTLSDHVLYAVICDAKKLAKATITGGEEEAKQEEFDWNKVKYLGDKEEEVVEKVDTAGPPKVAKDNVYEKTGPFAENIPLLIHRTLREQNYEYVYFVNEAGTKEIGVFIVLLEALVYK